MKRVIVNYSSRKYGIGQARLYKTVRDTQGQYEFYGFFKESHIGCKPHSESMYAFKPKSFLKANEMGYTTILWLDASMYVLKDLTPIFEQIERDGYYFQDSGWPNSIFTTPDQKEYFGTDKGIMISSGVLGLDLTSEVGREFLNIWNKASDDGMFNGSHEVTRHDQTAASLIIEQMGLTITENNTHWSYGTPEQTYPENILLIANGIV